MKKKAAAALIATVAVILSSCAGSSNSTGAGGSAKLTVLAAASLTNVFPKIAAAYNKSHSKVDFRFSFAGTDTLAAQIQQGAPADVFAGASTSYSDDLSKKKLIDAPKLFCTNQLVLLLPPTNPAHITSLKDLTKAGIKLDIAAPSVPAGSYALTVLQNLDSRYGGSYSKDVLANVVSHETDVEAVLTKVRLGEADAGFVYITDAIASGAKVKTVSLPSYAQAVATYPIAVVSSSKESSIANSFVQYVTSAPAQRMLRKAGFGPPPS